MKSQIGFFLNSKLPPCLFSVNKCLTPETFTLPKSILVQLYFFSVPPVFSNFSATENRLLNVISIPKQTGCQSTFSLSSLSRHLNLLLRPWIVFNLTRVGFNPSCPCPVAPWHNLCYVSISLHYLVCPPQFKSHFCFPFFSPCAKEFFWILTIPAAENCSCIFN